MKGLFIGVALIFVIGITGFLYRNALENPGAPGEGACTLDAKICPDGTGVGRVAPSCEFEACPFPNTAFPSEGIAFVVPEGYALRAGAAGDTSLVAVYEQVGTSTPKNTIVVRSYAIPEGISADTVILENTRLTPSDMQPEDMNAFSPKIIGTKTFLGIVIERFEAQVHSAYYLPRADDVLVFEILERDVTDWMEPGLIVDNLPEHQRLLRMLATLEVAS